ncbi:MAG TPA: O-antigen ligase family protein [Mycobacteriales bacterium]|nr:O-antigen ligase family protein [Mycobacteriales bacterium]
MRFTAASALAVRPPTVQRAAPILVTGSAVLGAFLFSAGGPVTAELLLATLFVVGFVGLSASRPAFSVIGLVAWVPIQTTVLSYLYHLGVPGSLARNVGYLKELWAIGLAIAVLRSGALRRRFDALDWLVVLYVGIASVYLFLPLAAPGALGGVPWSGRVNAWRLLALAVVVFFCARRLSFSAAVMSRLFVIVAVITLILTGFALWESIDANGFNDFLVNTIGLPAFKADLFDSPFPDPTYVLLASGDNAFNYTRVGSLFNNPLTLGFFMLIPFGLALERIGGRRMWQLAAVVGGASLYTIFLTVTRSAVVGAGVAVLLVAAFQASRASRQRLRLFVVLGIALALLLPVAGHSATVGRFEGLFNPVHRDDSSQEHVETTPAAFAAALRTPLGRGLGANTSTGTRFGVSTSITSDNSYIETANEIGMVPAVLFVAALLMLLRRLRERAQEIGAAASLAGGLWLAGSGLAVAGLFLQTWYDLTTSLAFWVLAGVALSDRAEPEEPDYVDAKELMTSAY